MANPGNKPSSNVQPLGTDSYGFVDEGTYFVVHNNQTGLANAATDNAFLATNPFVLVFNKDSSGGKNIYLDFLTLIATAAGTAGTNVQAAAVVDGGAGNRYTSGGTEITANINNPNLNGSNTSIARVYAGNITAAAASGSARTIFGNRYLGGAIPAVGDALTLKFGGNESASQISKVTITTSSQNVPKLVIPPQASALVYLWLASQTGASSFIPEMGWIER